MTKEAFLFFCLQSNLLTTLNENYFLQDSKIMKINH